MAKGRALSTGHLPRGGLRRNIVDRITDRPDMTSAVDRGRKASTQTNKTKNALSLFQNIQVLDITYMSGIYCGRPCFTINSINLKKRKNILRIYIFLYRKV